MDRRRISSVPEGLKKRLDAAHAGLLRVHKALLDHERTRYERDRGPVGGPVEFLQVVIKDPWFAWLRPVSELVVRIDELTMDRKQRDPGEGEAMLAEAARLMTPGDAGDFQREYQRAMQESPDVAAAHGEWKKIDLRRQG